MLVRLLLRAVVPLRLLLREVVLALRLRDPQDPALHQHDPPGHEEHHRLLAVGDDGNPVAMVDADQD